jgi:hypothetical protein
MDGFLQDDGASPEPGIVHLFLEYTSGATGAVPVALTRSLGFGKSATSWRTGVGAFTIPLAQNYVDLLDYNFVNHQTPYSASTGACKANLVTDAVKAGSPPSISIQWRNEAGTAEDPASGDRVRVHLVLQRLPPG